MTSSSLLPANFPRALLLGAVSGAQPKLLVRRIDGEYVTGLTDDELLSRHDYCENLVQQLVAYSRRKETENPDWTHEFNLERTTKALVQKGRTGEWDITVDEQAWMMGRIRDYLLVAQSSTGCKGSI
jgi:hypothetical protein